MGEVLLWKTLLGCTVPLMAVGVWVRYIAWDRMLLLACQTGPEYLRFW